MDLEKYLMTAIPAAVEAGQAILEVYRSDFDVEQKSDNSPLTMADSATEIANIRIGRLIMMSRVLPNVRDRA